MLQIGAFPYLFKKDKLYIMIIMNSSHKQWILPKGNTEDDLKASEVAQLEAMEEAGVIGKVLGKKIYKEFETEQGDILRFYPMPIDKILDKWPEDYFRKRELVTPEKALTMISRTEHVKAVKYFSNKDKSPLFSKEFNKEIS